MSAEYFKTQGLVIDKLDIGERDRLYSLLTKDFGKIKLIAKGIRRPEAKFAGHLDLLNLVSIIFVDSNNNIITDALLEDGFWDVKKDFLKFNLTLNILAVINKIMPEQEINNEAVDFIFKYLDFIRKQNINTEKTTKIIFIAFMSSILGKMGYLDTKEIEEKIKMNNLNIVEINKILNSLINFIKENFEFSIKPEF